MHSCVHLPSYPKAGGRHERAECSVLQHDSCTDCAMYVVQFTAAIDTLSDLAQKITVGDNLVPESPCLFCDQVSSAVLLQDPIFSAGPSLAQTS